MQNGATNYGRASAVSAAAPIVTGVIALLLEMDPTLDALQIKTLLHESARADAFTGAVPNPMWGYGKLDALAALDRLHEKLTRLEISPVSESSVRITSRGQNGKTYFFEASSDLKDWTRLSTNVAGLAPFALDISTRVSAAYYRLTR